MVLEKVNRKNKFPSRQSRYLSYPLKTMLYITLIQPRYDFACCCSWHQNFSVSRKLQTTQNSCIKCCLGLKDRSHIEKNNYEKINWLPVSNRVDQPLAVTANNFKNDLSTKYMDEIYTLWISQNIRTRRSTDSLVVPFYKREIARISIT